MGPQLRLVTSPQYLVLSTQSSVPSPQYPVLSTQSPVPSPQSPVPSPQSSVPSTQSPVPSTQYLPRAITMPTLIVLPVLRIHLIGASDFDGNLLVLI